MFASVLVCLQAKREVGGYVSASFNKFILCMILAGCAGGTVLQAALLSRLSRFWFASKRNGRLVIMFLRLSINLYCV